MDSRNECYETWKTSIGDYVVQCIKKSCLLVLAYTPEACFSSPYVGCMKLYWDLNQGEKLPLNFAQLFRKPSNLTLVHRHGAQDEILLVVPATRGTRFINVEEIYMTSSFLLRTSNK
jgi:hypothetical protein